MDRDGKVKWTRFLRSKINPSSLTGTAGGVGVGICLDRHENIYLTAHFQDTIVFDSGHQLTGGKDERVFICKYDSAGVFDWSVESEGTHRAMGIGVACNELGQIFATGYFISATSFSIAGTPASIFPNEGHAYIARLSPAGSIVWLKSVTGASQTNVESIAVNNSGMCAITGMSGRFDTTMGFIRFDTIEDYGLFNSMYVAMCDSNGKAVFVKKMQLSGDSLSVYANKVVLNDSGQLFISGLFDHNLMYGGLPSADTPAFFLAGWGRQNEWMQTTHGKLNYFYTLDEQQSLVCEPTGDLLMSIPYVDSVSFDTAHVHDPLGKGAWARFSADGRIKLLKPNGSFIVDASLGASPHSVSYGGYDAEFFYTTRYIITGWDSNLDTAWTSTIRHLLPKYLGAVPEMEDAATQMTVYPNPAFEDFAVHSRDLSLQVSVVAPDGREMRNVRTVGGQSIDISDLPSGLYLIRIQSENATIFRKLIKQ